jgi:predicted N-acetyltransferase YhbS
MVNGEAPPRRLIVRLTADHCVEDFDCGEPARNSWLATRAFAGQNSDDSRTYVAIEDGHVIGFCALTVSSIVRDVLTGPTKRNAPDPVSCILLAQLAVDLPYQGKGERVGRDLVTHAMKQAVKISELGGGRLFAVHPARPDLVGYYQKYGFISVDTVPPLMVMLMRKVRALLTKIGEESG